MVINVNNPVTDEYFNFKIIVNYYKRCIFAV